MRTLKGSSFGFTIVELLIVVVVIAVLASITIIAYNGIQSRARTSSAQLSTRQAVTKILEFAIENADSYPASLATVGITDTDGVQYHYSASNTSSPRTFCISASVSGTSYYMSQLVTEPTVGVCPSESFTSIYGSAYPYTANLYTDGGGSLKVATAFYSNSSAFTIKGGRVYLPSFTAGASLTIFYVVGWYGSSTFHQPDWPQVPSSIPGQFVTIPNSSLKVGWNEATFPSPAIINPFSTNVGGTSVWVGYYFSNGDDYVFSASPGMSAIPSTTNPHLFVAESNFEGVARSSNSLHTADGWQSALYGIDILTTGP